MLRLLSVMNVHLRLRLHAQLKLPDITHDTDDFTGALLSGDRIHCDYLADGILIRPEPVRHSLVDDYSPRAGLIVLFCEVSATHEGNLHHLEILRADRAVHCACAFARMKS